MNVNKEIKNFKNRAMFKYKGHTIFEIEGKAVQQEFLEHVLCAFL